VRNSGTTSTQNLNITDLLPPFITLQDPSQITANINGTPTNIQLSGTPTTPIFTPETQLAPGQTLTLNFVANISTLAAPGTLLQNTAIIQDGPNLHTNATDSGITLQSPNLATDPFIKTADKLKACPCDIITYTLSYTPSQNIPTHLAISDPIPPCLTLQGDIQVTIDNIPQNLTNLGDNSNIALILPIPLPAGSTLQITYSAQIDKCAPAFMKLQNSASLTDGHTSITSNTTTTQVRPTTYLKGSYACEITIPCKHPLPIKLNCLCGIGISSPDRQRPSKNRPQPPLQSFTLEPGIYWVNYRAKAAPLKNSTAKLGFTQNNAIIPTSITTATLSKTEKTTLYQQFTLNIDTTTQLTFLNLGCPAVFSCIKLEIVKLT